MAYTWRGLFSEFYGKLSMWLGLKFYIVWEIIDILLLTFIRFRFLDSQSISNGNRTEWSPIGRHEVLLPINHNFNKICDIIGYFFNQNKRNSKFCFASSEKKCHLSARVMARTVQLLRHDEYCPIKLSN